MKDKYSIGEIAKILKLHEQTIRDYERRHLLKPSRSPKGRRIFVNSDITRISLIATLTQEMGLNLAGVNMVLSLAKNFKMNDDELLDYVIDHKNSLVLSL